MGLNDIIETLKNIIPNAIVISNKAISQNGVYLFFDSLKTVNYKQDMALFQVIVISNSLTGASNSVVSTIAEIRQILLDDKNKFTGKDIFKSVESADFENSQFSYVINIEVEVNYEYEDDTF